jgi:hypothetical protein
MDGSLVSPWNGCAWALVVRRPRQVTSSGQCGGIRSILLIAPVKQGLPDVERCGREEHENE